MNAYYKIALMAVSCCWLRVAHGQDVDWPIYLGGKERALYSSLGQINREKKDIMEDIMGTHHF